MPTPLLPRRRRKARLVDLSVSRVDLVPAGANPLSHVTLAKAAQADPPVRKEDTMPDLTALEGLTDDEVAGIGQYVADLATALDAANAKAEEAAAALAKAQGDDTPDPDEVLKGLPPEVAERVRKAEADAADAVAKADAITKAERSRVFKARAAALVHLSGGDDGATRLGDILEKADRTLDPEDYAELERTLVAADSQITAGKLFAAKGADGGPVDDSPVVEKVNEAVAKHMAAGDDFVTAHRKARAEFPDEVAAYVQSAPSGATGA